MISIQNHPRFKKDCERYLKAIKECPDQNLKSELSSLYEQFLSTVKEVDSNFNFLTSERLTNSTQQTDTSLRLQKIRAKLEEKISTVIQ
jgi:hypothetical protein